MSIGDKIKKGILYVLLILLGAACLFPFLLMIVNATRSGVEITRSFTLIPSNHIKENWEVVFSYFNLFKGMWNSLLVAVPATLFTAYFSALTAYGLAMYQFKGNKLIFTTILVFMMIPGQLGLIGFYNLCTKLHLVNSYIPLVIPAIAAPGTVFFLRQYVLSVLPPSLIEAARIDGAGHFRTMTQIMLPQAMNLGSVIILNSVVGQWNSWLPASIYVPNKRKLWPLQLIIKEITANNENFLRSANPDYSRYLIRYAAIVAATLPIIILFPFFQDKLEKGVIAGGIKG